MPSARRRRNLVEEDSEEDEVRPTQRRRGSPSGDEEVDEEGEEVMDEGHEGDAQVVKRFVRYALACEYQRKYIRRADVTEKVFKKQRMPFKTYFDKTQGELRSKFGMEMCELPIKEKITMKEKLATQKSKSAATSSSYILKSILPHEYRSPKIIPPSSVVSTAEEASYVALVTLVVSLINMSPQNQCLEAKLYSYLNKLNIDIYMLGEKTPLMLKKMQAQGYIQRSVEKTNDDETIHWLVGPRGKVEVGGTGTAGFVSEVYGGAAPEDLEKRLNKSLAIGTQKQKAKAPKVERSIEANDNEDNADPGPSTQGRRRSKR